MLFFQRLPIHDFEPEFTDLFLTPHGLDFEPAARMFGFEYRRVIDYAGLSSALQFGLDGSASLLIEACTDFKQDISVRESLLRSISDELALV